MTCGDAPDGRVGGVGVFGSVAGEDALGLRQLATTIPVGERVPDTVPDGQPDDEIGHEQPQQGDEQPGERENEAFEAGHIRGEHTLREHPGRTQRPLAGTNRVRPRGACGRSWPRP